MTPETYMRRYHTGCGCEEETAVTAEELFPSCPLAAAEVGRESCGCGRSQTDPDPAPLPTCCCKASMVEALRLLCGTELASLVDFDAFFFLTDSLAVGSALTIPCSKPDNIECPEASFRRFSPCNCDLVDIDGTAYFADPRAACTALEDVEQLSLCSVKAAAFDLDDPDCPESCEDAVYRRAVRLLRRSIRSEGGSTGSCAACDSHCDCDDCCCDAGLLTELATRNLSRQVSLTVGPLILQDVTVLGSVGSVLVLASEEEKRIYFVCISQVEALG